MPRFTPDTNRLDVPAAARPGHGLSRRAWLTLALGAGVLARATRPATIAASEARKGRTGTVRPDADELTRESGRWGTLTYAPIVISPPAEFIPNDDAPPRPLVWRFPARTAQTVETFLKASGLSLAVVASLMKTARVVSGETSSVDVAPPVDLVRQLSPEIRARIYSQLAWSSLNPAQQQAFRFFGQSADQWLATAPVSRRTKDLVEPLIYRDGAFVYFADIDLVRPLIGDPDELRGLQKALLRQVTMVAHMQVPDPSALNDVVEYWGRGGRRTDIHPLLESIADTPGMSIDITHLLPGLPRLYLYRYPRISPGDLERPLLVNCLWTALNFFATEPDDRYLDDTVALDTLKRDYYFVQGDYDLGDLVTFTDHSGELFHVAVYLAGDLVFGKNGFTPLAPWTILPLDHLKGHYASQYATGWKVSYLRRKDL